MEKSILTKLRDFYHERQVFITGVTGFKGTWLALTLSELGAHVHGVGLLPPTESMFDIVELDKRVDVYNVSVTHPDTREEYRDFVKRVKPSVLFNLVSDTPNIRTNDRIQTFESNIMGTAITYETLKEINELVSLVNTEHIASDSKAHRSYDLSRRLANELTVDYENKYPNLKIATIGNGTLLGGGDFGYNHLVPNIFTAMRTGTTIKIRHPELRIRYEHVFNLIMDYLIVGMNQYTENKSAGKRDSNHVYRDIPNIDVIKVFNRYWDFNYEIIEANSDQQVIQPSLLEPSVPIWLDIEEAIINSAIWYNYYIDRANMYEFTKEQIKDNLRMFNNTIAH